MNDCIHGRLCPLCCAGTPDEPESIVEHGLPPSEETTLFTRLRNRPALRHAVARTEAESAAAREQYCREQRLPEGASLIRTRDVRSELLSLLSELAGPSSTRVLR